MIPYWNHDGTGPGPTTGEHDKACRNPPRVRVGRCYRDCRGLRTPVSCATSHFLTAPGEGAPVLVARASDPWAPLAAGLAGALLALLAVRLGPVAVALLAVGFEIGVEVLNRRVSVDAPGRPRVVPIPAPRRPVWPAWDENVRIVAGSPATSPRVVHDPLMDLMLLPGATFWMGSDQAADVLA